MNKPTFHFRAHHLYMMAIAWFVAGIGSLISHTGMMAYIFAGMGALHLVGAIVADIVESKREKQEKDSKL